MIHRRKPNPTSPRVPVLGRKPGGTKYARCIDIVKGKPRVYGCYFNWNAKRKKHENIVFTHDFFLKGSLSRIDKRIQKL